MKTSLIRDAEAGRVAPLSVESPPGKSKLGEIAAWFKAVDGAAPPPAPPWKYTAATFFGSLIGISTIGLLTKHTDFIWIVGSFGAMAVIVFSLIPAPVAQPRNVIGGNTIGGAVGVAVYKLFLAYGVQDDYRWLAGGLAVAITVALQERTRTVHPPGGATSLIAVLGPAPVHDAGWLYVLFPACFAAVVLVLVAFVFNRAVGRTYPQYWW
jgi:CBS-domain-containing membrane protein